MAVLQFRGRGAVLVRRLKYGPVPLLARPLGELLAGAAAAAWTREPPDVVIPIPLHPRRERARGFNQAFLLALPVARALGVPLSRRCLIRVRDSPPQASLDSRGRAENLRDAFRVPRGGRVSRRSVLLVDDVLTTGHTLGAAARALRGAGAREVLAAVVAVTPPAEGARGR